MKSQTLIHLAAPMLLSLTFLQPAAAEVKPASLFSDNMVLQQGMRDPVWGTAAPGEQVSVTIDQQKVTSTTDKDGKWLIQLGPLKVGGPLKMLITGPDNTVTINNVAVGEVWVASGQSNMEFRVPGSLNAPQEIASADYPMIRSFTPRRDVADQPQTVTTGHWDVCTPQTVGGFSAVGYFFARELHKALNEPIGLIHSSWGGTPAEAWTSRPALEANPDLAKLVSAWDKRIVDYPAARAKYEDALKQWQIEADKAKAEGRPAPRKPADSGGPNDPHRTSGLYNAMIAPLIPYGMKGVIWYQGESNTGQPALYQKLFPAMIQDWRRNWGEGDFPFLFVQLANFMKPQENPSEGGWAELREAQLMTLALPHTGMASAIDIGDAGNIHPKNKQEVGRRLALAALATEYGKQMEYSGPMYDSMTVEGNKIRLHFKHVDGGLAAKGEKLTGFAIAGEDHKFFWGDAQIDGDTVVVSSDQVAQPTIVRYAWANNPVVSLYNKEGLPASSFRTDAPVVKE